MKQQKRVKFSLLALVVVAGSIFCMENNIGKWAKQRPGLRRLLGRFSDVDRPVMLQLLHDEIKSALRTLALSKEERCSFGAHRGEKASFDEMKTRLLVARYDVRALEQLPNHVALLEDVLHQATGRRYEPTDRQIIESFSAIAIRDACQIIDDVGIGTHEADALIAQQLERLALFGQGVHRWRAGI